MLNSRLLKENEQLSSETAHQLQYTLGFLNDNEDFSSTESSQMNLSTKKESSGSELAAQTWMSWFNASHLSSESFLENLMDPERVQFYAKLLTSLSGKQALEVLKGLYKDLFSLACSPTGLKFLLSLLENIQTKKLFIVLNAIKERIEKLAVNPNGAKLLVLISKRLPRRDLKWMFTLLEKYFEDLSTDANAVEVLCGLFRAVEGDYAQKLEKFVLKNICKLIIHKQGHKLVVSFILNRLSRQSNAFLGQFFEMNLETLLKGDYSYVTLLNYFQLQLPLSLSMGKTVLRVKREVPHTLTQKRLDALMKASPKLQRLVSDQLSLSKGCCTNMKLSFFERRIGAFYSSN